MATDLHNERKSEMNRKGGSDRVETMITICREWATEDADNVRVDWAANGYDDNERGKHVHLSQVGLSRTRS